MNCPKCKGSGETKIKLINDEFFVYCDFCKGHGNVNWIENIFGASQEKEIIFSADRRIGGKKEWNL